MKAVVFFSLSIIVWSVKAWPAVSNTLQILPNAYKMHMITDCMHVASEPGDYIFKKVSPPTKIIKDESVLTIEDTMNVCGLYVISEPDTVIEITMKHYDVNCETGGLLAFVDGWELNGEFFPGVGDHHRLLQDRVVEFCNNYKQWPRISNKKFFRSSQNAALLQYRIPRRGSFVANVRLHKITQPCNVLVQDTAAIYNMANNGHRRNCTISALFPAVVELGNLKIGSKAMRQVKVNYECTLSEDRLEIGGSSGLDAVAMEKSSDVCGYTEEQGPAQAIFCGVTTVRLISSGRYQNQVALMLRKAEEDDLDIATLVCPL